MKHLRLFAPAIALTGWAGAAAVGVDVETLRVVGPLATALGCVFHVLEEIRMLREH